MAVQTDTETTEDEWRREDTLSERVLANPRPALRWLAVATILLALEFGAVAGGVLAMLDGIVMSVTAIVDELVGIVSAGAAASVVDAQQSASNFISGMRGAASDIPTLLSRETIPNRGYKTGPNGPWKGTFLGLAPAYAWAIRVTLILAYAAVVSYWLFRGWIVFRNHYRREEWTPTDDVVDRLRGHRWGEFGIVVILLFLTMALFAPALGPTTVDRNTAYGEGQPYSYEMKYFDSESGQVQTISVGEANFQSKSVGDGGANVGPMSYDAYGRWHPFGTDINGRDLFMFLMNGARLTMLVAGIAIGLQALIATALSLLSSYYKGVIDQVAILVSDGIVSVPGLILLLMVEMAFRTHWISDILAGGFLLALVFGLSGWPYLWRAVRGPALQVSEEEWIDAAKSFGQRPRTTMRKHMLPFVVPYLLIYASMSVGGIIITLSALSFIGQGMGISGAPSWGKAIQLGRPLVNTQSWHIATIPGVLIVILVTGLNAFSDGVSDAIDPESEASAEDEAAAGGAAG